MTFDGDQDARDYIKSHGDETQVRRFLLGQRRDEAADMRRARLADWYTKDAKRQCGACDKPEGVSDPYAGMAEPLRGPEWQPRPPKPSIAKCVYPWPVEEKNATVTPLKKAKRP